MNASHAAVSAHTTGESRTPAEASVTNAQIFYAVYITENSCVLFWVIPPCLVVFSLPRVSSNQLKMAPKTPELWSDNKSKTTQQVQV